MEASGLSFPEDDEPSELAEIMLEAGPVVQLPASFLDKGALAKEAVAFIQAKDSNGTGILIAPCLLMTCHHVLPDDDYVAEAKFIFHFQVPSQSELTMTTYQATKVCWRDPALDCLVLELQKSAQKEHFAEIATYSSYEDKSIIVAHHPFGMHLTIATSIIEGFNTDIGEVRYQSATQKSSSGAPVFNTDGKIIAMHRGKSKDGQYSIGITLVTIMAKMPPHVKQQLKLPRKIELTSSQSRSHNGISRRTLMSTIGSILTTTIGMGIVFLGNRIGPSSIPTTRSIPTPGSLGQITNFHIPTLDSHPGAVIAGSDNNLWFVEWTGNKIGRITMTGQITEFPIQTSDSEPADITEGPDGNLWFTEWVGNNIGRITVTGQITEFPIPSAISHPCGITSGPDGNLWFTEWNTSKIGRITPDGVISEFSLPTANSYPNDIVGGPFDNLYFTETMGNKIGRITPTGSITEYFVPTVNSGPSGITKGTDGNLWFTEDYADKIGRVTSAGSITEFIVPTTKSGPNGITTGPDGNLWFTEKYGDKIGRITTNGLISEFIVPTYSYLSGITSGPDRNLWFTEFHSNTVDRVVP